VLVLVLVLAIQGYHRGPSGYEGDGPVPASSLA